MPRVALRRKSTRAMIEQAPERFREACGLSAPLPLECEGPSQTAAASALRSLDCPFVCDELDVVQKLTQELSALQAKTGQAPDSTNARLTSGVDRGCGEPEPVEARNHINQDKKPFADRPDQGGDRARPRFTEPATSSKPPSAGVPPAPESVPPGSDGARAVDDEQIHAHLTRRIADLQRERQAYWQGILSTINR
jgi:hypothetical protein